MHRGIKAVVVFLAVNLAIASFCAQACSTPQPDLSQCPQHPHTGNTNCCDHSNDVTMTLKVDCTAGLKSMTVLFVPPLQMNSFNLRIPVASEFHRFHPPASRLSPANFELSTILRV